MLIKKQFTLYKYLIILSLMITLFTSISCDRTQNKIYVRYYHINEAEKIEPDYKSFEPSFLKFILLNDYYKNIAFSPILYNNSFFYLRSKTLHTVDLDKIKTYESIVAKFDQIDSYKIVETDKENICIAQDVNLLHKPYIIDGERIFYAGYFINDNTSLGEGYISCYNLKSKKIDWKKNLNLGLTIHSLDHTFSLLKTPEGILFTTIKPSLMYLLDKDTGKIKWIYDPEKDFNEVGNNVITHSMADIRKFNFNILYFCNEGILADLQYTDKDSKFYIEKFLLINWNGKMVRELKEKPILVFDGKYLYETRKEKNNKLIIELTCKTISEGKKVWKFEYENYYDEKCQLPYKENFSKSEDLIYLTVRGKEKEGCYMYGVNLYSGRTIFKGNFKEEIIDIYPLEDKVVVLLKDGALLNNSEYNVYDIVSLSRDKSFSINWIVKMKVNKENESDFFTEENINYVIEENSKIIVLLNNSYIIIDPFLKSASISTYYQIVEELNARNSFLESFLFYFKSSRLLKINVFENKKWIILAFHEQTRGMPIKCVMFFNKNYY